jgi:hypothetical protein
MARRDDSLVSNGRALHPAIASPVRWCRSRGVAAAPIAGWRSTAICRRRRRSRRRRWRGAGQGSHPRQRADVGFHRCSADGGIADTTRQ